MEVIVVSEFKFDLPGLHSLCLLPARLRYRAIALLFTHAYRDTLALVHFHLFLTILG